MRIQFLVLLLRKNLTTVTPVLRPWRSSVTWMPSWLTSRVIVMIKLRRGEVLGDVVKALLGMHTTCLGTSPCTASECSFLLMHTLRGSKGYAASCFSAVHLGTLVPGSQLQPHPDLPTPYRHLGNEPEWKFSFSISLVPFPSSTPAFYTNLKINFKSMNG